MAAVFFITGVLCAFAAVIVLWVKLAGRTRLAWSVAGPVIVALSLASWVGIKMAVLVGAGV
jgi:hypothetical protein